MPSREAEEGNVEIPEERAGVATPREGSNTRGERGWEFTVLPVITEAGK